MKHLTWRRVLNKTWQMFTNFKNSFTLRKISLNNSKFIENFESITANIGASDGSAYYSKALLKVGIITDEFMYNYYKDAAGFIIINHDHYKEIIDNVEPDIVMYVSCWRGMCNNDWYGDILHGDVPDVIKYANNKEITTIFQTIEDPTNYDRYLPIANECDYIFTSDTDCIERYKKDTGNTNVFLLEYGVNPIFHNPIGINKKYEVTDQYDYLSVFFAGSWMDRYKNRCRDIKLIFDGILDAGKNLVIADRNIDVRLPGYRFPKRYRSFTIPSIDHTLLQKVHKLFRFNVNINTVQDSPTMCAMRVYELQALGCLMLSNYSLAVSENFPGIFIVNNSDEVKEIMGKYPEEELYRMQVENLRNVMTSKTVFDRMNYIFEKCGVNYKFPEKKVTVLCKEKTDNICRMFENQTYVPKELVTESHYDNELNSDGFVAFFSDKYEYGDNYLTDMLNAFKYCDVEFVTKEKAIRNQEYEYTDISEDLYATVMTSSKYRSSDLDHGKITGNGFRIDGFELNEIQNVVQSDSKIAVIVPVYNNGEYLEGRCFRSLLRSSIFDIMHIYLIDDGSDDENTIKIINKLERRYSNVTSYFFETGGSGSAARPRNKGVEISDEPYITYLDPDNEAINDGYSKLYEKLIETGADMTFGAIYMRATADKLMRIGYLFKDKLIEEPRKLLVEEKFRSQSIQACMMKRELIVENKIENPEGAFGEDTLFFHELMINAGKVYYINLPIHTYYAQRMNSSINDIGTEFFRKSLILEAYQVNRLREYGLLDEYINRKLDFFVINWYIDKLKDTSADEKDKCIEIISDIVDLYGKKIGDYHNYIKEII